MPNFFQHDRAIVSPQAVIGRGTRIWAFTNIQEGAVIGEDCNICDGCFVEKGSRLGNGVRLKNHVSVFDGIVLEDYVFVGANTSFINDRFPRGQAEGFDLEPTLVKHGATIGAGSVILCGVTIGEYAFVGAGSVVTKDVAPYTLVFGNPARFVSYVDQAGRRTDQEPQ